MNCATCKKPATETLDLAEYPAAPPTLQCESCARLFKKDAIELGLTVTSKPVAQTTQANN